MIPDFTHEGLLPAGIHKASLEELKERFAVFDRSDRRLRVFDRLANLLDEAKKSRIVQRVLIAGSFVTAEPEPNDFDCILVLDPTIVGRTLPPFQYNLVSRRMARRMFGGDIMPALDGSAALAEYVDFFQTTRDGEQMGLVEIEL